MNLVDSVYEVSESFMKDPKYVFMNNERIGLISDDMLEHGKLKFPLPDIENEYKGVFLELIASSINYCYWYGKHDIRPNGSSSTMMYELLQNAFFDYEKRDFDLFRICINRFIRLLSIRRFPLIEERNRHLRELWTRGEDFVEFLISEYKGGNVKVDYWMNELVETFPGFASDIFLKRASLFFIQLFRRFGWFEKDLHKLHVPADYQIPKMLNYFRCLIYEPILYNKIKSHELIAKGSLMECEIRAATVLTIKKLCEITGWNVAEVDGFFFTKRHETPLPFHLTITTDY